MRFEKFFAFVLIALLVFQSAAFANYWTQWFDRDDPTAVGDFESFPELRNENPGICTNPISVECKTLSGVPASQTGQVVIYNTEQGCFCRNENNSGGCLDYTVRFECPGSAQNLPPVVSSIGGPTTLGAGQTGTWSISATDPENGPLTYSVNWGDGSSGTPKQTAGFTHSYSQAGSYTVSFTVTDSTGASAQSTISVAVVGSQTIPCTDSDGGDNVFVRGTASGFQAGASNPSSMTDYCITSNTLDEFYCSAGNALSSVIELCPNSGTCSNGACARSNRPPVFSSIGGLNSLNVGQTGTWTVYASDPDNDTLTYSANWGDGSAGSGITQASTFTHVYSQAGTYTVSFTAYDSAGASSTTMISVAVTRPMIPCKDSDGGQNIYVAGIGTGDYTRADAPIIFGNNFTYSNIVALSPYNYSIFYDHCESLTQLNEAYCNQTGQLDAIGINCPAGYTCSVGACVQISQNQPPVISMRTGPASLNISQAGTWSITATDPENGPLTYSVNWGDSAYRSDSKQTAAPTIQTATFTHSYSQAGTYTPVFTVTDSAGASAQTDMPVIVAGSSSIPCTDSDGGDNIYVMGTCKDSSAIGQYSDYCDPAGLEEVSCQYIAPGTGSPSIENRTVCVYSSKRCQSGYICSNGACVLSNQQLEQVGVSISMQPPEVSEGSSVLVSTKVSRDSAKVTAKNQKKSYMVVTTFEKSMPTYTASSSTASASSKDMRKVDYITLKPGESTTLNAYFSPDSEGTWEARSVAYENSGGCVDGSVNDWATCQLVGQMQGTMDVASPPQPPESYASIDLHTGWNMVSLPVGHKVPVAEIAAKCSVQDHAWQLTETGYAQKTVLEPGVGYWIKSYSDCQFEFPATFRAEKETFSRKLFSGWNLVGAAISSVSMQDNYGDCQIRSGPWYYQYSPSGTSYASSAVLEPGRAYWFKVAAACTLGSSDMPPAPPS